MRRLDIYALGVFRLVSEDTPAITLTSRRAQLLLTYLATERSRPQHRLTLAALCWPDIDEARARASLRVELHKIRRALQQIGLADALRADDTWVQLVPEAPIELDSRAFALEAETGLTEEAVLPVEQMAHLVRAAGLYQGEFLDGSYDEWAVGERNRLSRLYDDVLTRLVELHLQARTYEHVIAYARVSLSRDPLNEVMHRALMRALAASGQRASALAQYRACAALLMEELGIVPDEETERLRVEIETHTAQIVSAAEAISPLLEAALPFVGREREAIQIQTRINALAQQRGSMLVVTGEAGIGKSRMLQMAATAAERVQLNVIEGRCFELERGMLLQPLIDGLRRQRLRFMPQFSAMPITVQRTLAGLLPELSPGNESAASAQPSFDRGDQKLALARLLRAIAESSGGLVLLLDDVHRADVSTAELLHYLGRSITEFPLLIVIAVLDGDLPPHVQAVIEAVSERIPGEVMVPAPLEQHDIGGLLAQHPATRRLAGAQQQRLAQHLSMVSGGNPFFVLELLRGLAESGRLTELLNNSADLPLPVHLPASLRDAIARRLRPLNPATRLVLNQASVIGLHFHWDVLLAVSEQDPDSLLLAVEELVSRRVLRSHDGEWYDFQHELVREVVYQALQLPRRRRIHGQVALALARATDLSDQLDGELAYHFLRSDQPRRAVNHLIRAGDLAHRLGGFDRAEELYTRARDLLNPVDEVLEVADVWSKLALNALAAGRAADARRFQQLAFRGWEALPAVEPLPADATGIHADFRMVSSYAGISSFDPAYGAGREAWRIIVQLFEGLVRYDPRMHVVPALAERWEISEDGRRYRFQLRRDARWSDDRPVTAHDVVFAWCRALRIATISSLSSMLFDIVGAPELAADPQLPDARLAAIALDDHTLEVQLSARATRFLYVMALPIAFPVPRHAVADYGNQWSHPQHLITNGPFRLAANSDHALVRLERSPTYHARKSGNIARVEIVVEPDPVRRLQSYLRGDVDMVAELSAQELRWARHRRPAELVIKPALSTTFTAYNWRVAPLHDLSIRQALALAVDRDSWAQQLEGQDAVGANGGFVPPGIAGHLERVAPPFDPERARALVARRLPLHVQGEAPVLATSAGFREGALYIAEQWREHLGLQVTVRVEDVGVLIHDWLAGRIPLLHLARSTNYPDADNWLRYAVRGLQVFDPTQTRAAQLLAAASEAGVDAVRIAAYQALDRLLVEQTYMLTPFAYEPFAWLVRPWVQGFHFGAFSHWTPLNSLSIDTERRVRHRH